MSKPLERLSQFVKERGVGLLVPCGVNEYALSRADALHAIDLLESAGIPILGGDLYMARHGRIENVYTPWASEPSAWESETEYARRSCNESRSFISKILEPLDSVAMFVLVVEGWPDTVE